MKVFNVGLLGLVVVWSKEKREGFANFLFKSWQSDGQFALHGNSLPKSATRLQKNKKIDLQSESLFNENYLLPCNSLARRSCNSYCLRSCSIAYSIYCSLLRCFLFERVVSISNPISRAKLSAFSRIMRVYVI